MDFVGADVVCSNLWEGEIMKLKDLGYALIGVFVSADQNKEFEKRFREDLIAVYQNRRKLEKDLQRNYKARGEEFRKIEAHRIIQEERCNHLKGGSGLDAIVLGRGDSPQYAVIKHTHRNGDMHIHCLRCPKVWMPGDPEYYRAVNFKTNNVPSTDVLVASQLENGTITGDFAEAFRKWTNARPYKGIAFYPTKGITEATRLAEELQSTYPQQKRPIVVRKEFIPTLVKTEAPAKDDNPKFNVVDGRPSLVS